MSEKIDVAKVLIENDDGEFLMLKKSDDYDRMGEKWEQPGGKIEEGEDRFEAARREVEQETGLVLEEMEDLVRLEIEDEKTVNCFVLYCQNWRGKLDLSKEHIRKRWFSREELEKLDWHRDASYIIPVIRYLEDYREEERQYGQGEEIEVVKLLVRNDEGKFLACQKISKDKVHSGHSYTLYGRMAGKWELPGGTFKKGEDLKEAAKREVKEELNIEIEDAQLVVREEIEEKNDVNTYILLVEDWEGEISLSKEHQKFKWVSPDKYLDMDWHQDAGYGYSPMKFLDHYLETN